MGILSTISSGAQSLYNTVTGGAQTVISTAQSGIQSAQNAVLQSANQARQVIVEAPTVVSQQVQRIQNPITLYNQQQQRQQSIQNEVSALNRDIIIHEQRGVQLNAAGNEINAFIGMNTFTQQGADYVNKTVLDPFRANVTAFNTQTQALKDRSNLTAQNQTVFAAQQKEYEKNLIFGIIPNPFQSFDKTIAGFLESTPIHQSMKRTIEKARQPNPNALITIDLSPKKETLDKFNTNPVVQVGFGVVTGYAEDVQQRPTKFITEIGVGYGFGRIAEGLGTGWRALETSGRISERTARITPRVVQGALAAGYVGGTGLNVMAAETPKEKGEVIGRSLAELSALGIGYSVARGGVVRPGFSTEQIKPDNIPEVNLKNTKMRIKNGVPTFELPEIIDVRPKVDLTNAKVRAMSDYVRPITKAERAMIVDQYRLSPSEVTLARLNKLTLQDVLAVRTRMEVPPTSLIDVAPPKTKMNVPVVNLTTLKPPKMDISSMDLTTLRSPMRMQPMSRRDVLTTLDLRHFEQTGRLLNANELMRLEGVLSRSSIMGDIKTDVMGDVKVDVMQRNKGRLLVDTLVSPIIEPKISPLSRSKMDSITSMLITPAVATGIASLSTSQSDSRLDQMITPIVGTLPKTDMLIDQFQSSSFDLQTPLVGVVPLRTSLQVPQTGITTTFVDVPDVFISPPPTIPPIDITIPPPIFVPPVIPGFPMAPGGGGGGGNAIPGRSGFIFEETFPLGDFMSDTFGIGGLSFEDALGIGSRKRRKRR